MVTDPRFWWGVALGAAAYCVLYGWPEATYTQAGVGGMVPKPLRREGRLLRGLSGRPPAWWPFQG